MADRKPIRFLLIKLFFPLIYAVFFIVQLFINIDTTLIQFSDRYQIIRCRNQSDHSVALTKAKGSQPVKTRFRLHKNFQPAVIVTFGDVHVVPVVCLISLQRIRYANPFIKNLLADTRLLRGPPLTA
jgi:hypothetical protein